jgi:hypothetical protein
VRGLFALGRCAGAHANSPNKVIRPVAPEYGQRQEFPWPVLEEVAERGFYSPFFS